MVADEHAGEYDKVQALSDHADRVQSFDVVGEGSGSAATVPTVGDIVARSSHFSKRPTEL
ncbi:hypothetical protein [Streptomyces sp. NPDC006267]|uniref:hypothetical protein n=1 Tax=Streptomyces sp. NPDC006267 TaxID=3157173 RepID=UPI0033A412B2